MKAPGSIIDKRVLKNGLQGKSLLAGKKLICGDEWDAVKLSNDISQKFFHFCDILGLLDSRGDIKRQVLYLLDFAGYIERGGEIETASHYREVKKVTGATNKEPEKIDPKPDNPANFVTLLTCRLKHS